MPRRPDMPPLRRADLDPDPIAQFAPGSRTPSARSPLPEAITLATVDDGGLPTPAWSCSRASTRTAFASSPTTSRRRRRSSPARRGGADRLLARARPPGAGPRDGRAARRVADSDAYFATRPRDSQLGAWASPQSRPLDSRDELDRRLARGRGTLRRTARSPGRRTGAATCCDPQVVEFWQGQVGRLHDRFRYARDGGGWRIERLAP